jgi:hypothetical protein
LKKLIELKEYLSLEEGAKYLTSVADASVSVEDLLQLALAGHLQLSALAVNAVPVHRGKIVPSTECERVPSLDGKRDVLLADHLEGDRFLKFSKAVEYLDGVFDLPMRGGERLDVEHKLQMRTGGPAVTAVSIDGTFLHSWDGTTWFKILDHYENNEFFDKAKLKKPYTNPANYYPAGGLPDDIRLVLRPSCLFKFVRTLSRARTRDAAVELEEGEIPFRLAGWFRYDTWDRDIALQLLCGLDPDFTEFSGHDSNFQQTGIVRCTYLTGKTLEQPDTSREKNWSQKDASDDDVLMGLSLHLEKMRDIWDSGGHQQRNAPVYYVDWALGKGFAVPWLDFARSEKLLMDTRVGAQAVPPRDSQSEATPLGTRERNTLLAMIAVLCKQAGYDLFKPAKTAGAIQGLAASQGVQLGESTIESHLKRIPDALAARTK